LTTSSTVSSRSLGAFDDPFVLQPRFSVWEKRKNDWLEIVGDDVEHID